MPMRTQSRPDQQRIFPRAARVFQNPREDMDTRKVELPPKGTQAVRGVSDKANDAQGDRYTAEDHAKSLFVDTPLP
jgi:hypothetical protein